MENKSGSNKNKHLTQSERTEIQECLDKRMSFKAIGKLLGKDPTTISYEVKHHRKEYRNAFVRSSGSCPELIKAPFVCNGCKKRHSSSCPYVRFIYQGTEAPKEYKELLTSSREGVPLCKEEFYKNDCIVSAGVAKGQHIYHILKSNKDVTWSKSSTYRYVKRGYCSFLCWSFLGL